MNQYRYDQVPYDTRAYPHAHPRNLAAIGALYGLTPPPVENCRVLVLGCAQGGNLFPAASMYPASRFVGIDNSVRQIEAARATAEALGLDNTTLHCMDIMDFGDTMGQFDYIIAHGIFSWIPEQVRDKVFRICQTRLSRHGIAYISYNTLPGWHINGIVRDIMCYRFREYEDPEAGLDQAITYLESIVSAMPAQNNPYMALLQQIQSQVSANNRSYLLHEYLSEINEAFYFHEIVRRGDAMGLRYLADATFIGREFCAPSMELQQRFRSISHDAIDYEQHFDFMSNRRFRCSLFCHRDNSLCEAIDPAPAWPLYFSSMAQKTELPPDRLPGISGFRNEWGGVMIDASPVFQTAMHHLIDLYPRALTFAQLAQAVIPGFKPENDSDEAHREAVQLYGKLLRARASGVLNITMDKPATATMGRRPPSSYRPLALPFARLQASSGNVVVSAWNENVGLNPFSRQVLTLLDGSRRLKELKRTLITRYAQGGLVIPGTEPALMQGEALAEAVGQRLEESLAFFSRSGLLTETREAGAN